MLSLPLFVTGITAAVNPGLAPQLLCKDGDPPLVRLAGALQAEIPSWLETVGQDGCNQQ